MSGIHGDEHSGHEMNNHAAPMNPNNDAYRGRHAGRTVPTIAKSEVRLKTTIDTSEQRGASTAMTTE